jgi:hypothetical protein
MGTSVTQSDQTYGHRVPDSEKYLRGLLENDAAAPIHSDRDEVNA